MDEGPLNKGAGTGIILTFKISSHSVLSGSPKWDLRFSKLNRPCKHFLGRKLEIISFGLRDYVKYRILVSLDFINSI